MKKWQCIIHFLICFAFLAIIGSCKVEQAYQAQLKDEGDKKSLASTAVVRDVRVINGKLEILGRGLENIEQVSIQAEGTNESFSIQDKSSERLLATGLRNIGLVAGKVFKLVLADAYGSSSFQIQTSLRDKSVTGEKLHNMGAMDGDTLVYNRLNDIWEARALTGLKLRGTWNAELNEPQLADRGYQSSPMKGDYYIVSESGASEIDGNDDWLSGNWIVFNGSEWEKVSNSTSAASFNGRTGIVSPEEGDYDLDLLGDVETSGAAIGHVLKFDGSKWAPAPDASADNADSLGSEHIADGSLTNADISPSAGIDPTKVSGLPGVISSVASNTTAVGANAANIASNTAGVSSNQAAITANATAITGKAPLPASACAGTDKLVWSAGAFSCAIDYDTNTNAATMCSAGEYLDGDGSCKVLSGGDLHSDGSVPMAADLDMAGNTLTNLQGLSVDSGKLLVGPDLGGSYPGILQGQVKFVDTTNDQLTLSLFNAKSHDVTNNGGVNIEMYGRRNSGPYDQRVPLAKLSATPEFSGFNSAASRRASLVFSTNWEGQGGLSEKMRLTSDGKLGIGTSSPGHTLHAVGQSFRFEGTGSSSTALTFTPQTANNFNISATNLNIVPNYLKLESRSMRLNTNVGHEPIRLMTQGTTRLYVGEANNGGKIGIGTTVPTEQLEVVGCIKYSGGTIGTACSSDRRLKDDIEDVNFGASALEKFTQLRPRTYVYKTNPDASFYGLIAQEVLEVDKEMVTTKENGYYAVDYERGKWLHFKASQEMARKIAKLERENQDLKARLERLEAAVEAMQ